MNLSVVLHNWLSSEPIRAREVTLTANEHFLHLHFTEKGKGAFGIAIPAEADPASVASVYQTLRQQEKPLKLFCGYTAYSIAEDLVIGCDYKIPVSNQDWQKAYVAINANRNCPAILANRYKCIVRNTLGNGMLELWVYAKV